MAGFPKLVPQVVLYIVFSDLLDTQFFVFIEYNHYFSTPPPHTHTLNFLAFP